MTTPDPPPAPPPPPTPTYLRVIFGLAAVGLTVRWFDRLGRVIDGRAEGGTLAWYVVSLGLLPLAAGYCAYRAVVSRPRAS